jgi:hypothetical protein
MAAPRDPATLSPTDAAKAYAAKHYDRDVPHSRAPVYEAWLAGHAAGLAQRVVPDLDLKALASRWASTSIWQYNEMRCSGSLVEILTKTFAAALREALVMAGPAEVEAAKLEEAREEGRREERARMVKELRRDLGRLETTRGAFRSLLARLVGGEVG